MSITLPAPPAAGGGASVVGETYINVDHPSFDGDIQAAIDAHTAGVFYIPTTTDGRTMTATIELGANMGLQGDGRGAPGLRWDDDLGEGEYAIAPAIVNDGTYWEQTIRDLEVTGPVGSLVNGTAGCDMDGIRADRRMFIDGCNVTRFRAGVVFGRDHAYLANSSVYQNHYNVYWPNDSLSRGDHGISYCDLNGATMASLVCGNETFMDNVHVLKSHTGGAPYAFYREEGAAGTAWMINCLFEGTAVEFCGNGVAYGPNTNDNWVGTIVIGGHLWAVNGDPVWSIASGHDRDASFELWRVDGCRFDTRIGSLGGGGSAFKCGDRLVDTTFAQFDDVYAADATSPIVTSDTGNVINVRWDFTAGRMGGVIIWTQDAVVAGDVLEVVGRDETKLATATGVPAGVAVTASAGNGYLALARTGTQAVKVAGAVTAGRALVHDTANPGKLKQAAGAAGEYVVAVALASGTDTTINADLRMGT